MLFTKTLKAWLARTSASKHPKTRVHTSPLALAAAKASGIKDGSNFHLKFPLPVERGCGASDVLLKGLGLTRAARLHTPPLVDLLAQSTLMLVDPEPKKSLQPPPVSGTGCAPVLPSHCPQERPLQLS